MKATLARRDLAKMVALTRNPERRRRADARLILSASGGRVYVEADGLTCGWEALVFVEGACRLASRNTFSKVLRTFRGRNITLEADELGLRIGNFQMSLEAYSASASDPAEDPATPPPRLQTPIHTRAEFGEQSTPPGSPRPSPVEAEEEFSPLEIELHKAGRDAQGRRLRVVMLAGPGDEVEEYEAALAGTPCHLESFGDGWEALAWMRGGDFVRGVLVLSELATPGLSVVPLIREVRATFPDSAIVLCTVSRALAVEAFEAGAFGVVREPSGASVFRGTVLRAWRNLPLPLPPRESESLPPAVEPCKALAPLAPTAPSPHADAGLLARWLVIVARWLTLLRRPQSQSRR